MGGGKGSPSGTTEQTTTNEPWAEAQPYWKDIYGDIFGTAATTTGGTPGTPATERHLEPNPNDPEGGMMWVEGTPAIPGTPGTTIPGTPGLIDTTKFIGANPDMLAAWDAIRKRATDGSPLIPQAQGVIGDILGGQYLNPETNPALKNIYRMGLEEFAPQIQGNQQTGYGGDWASGTLLSRGMSDLGAKIYEPEMQRLMQAVSMAPQAAEWDYADATKLLALGESERGLAQEEEMFPWDLRERGARLLAGAGGGTSTTTSPYWSPDPLMTLLGLGAMGGGAYAGKACWVAREVYGEDNPKWRIFREWLITRAPKWFYNLYIRHGEKFAKAIRNKPEIKWLIRFWMDGRIRSMGGSYERIYAITDAGRL